MRPFKEAALDSQGSFHVGAGAPTRPVALWATPVGERGSPARVGAPGPTWVLLRVAVVLLVAGSASGQQNQVALTRDNSTIALEAYAPNIVRVTVSLEKDQATASPGFGVSNSPLSRPRLAASGIAIA